MKKLVILLLLMSNIVYANSIESIQHTNKIRVGIKYNTPPFGFKEGKKIKGFDIDLSKLIIEKIKQKYNLPTLKVFYKKVIPENREQKLIDNKVDIVIATYSINKKRKKFISFSQPYFTDEVIIVAKKRNPKIVGVLKNSTTKDIVIKMGYKIKKYLTYKEMYKAFDNNKIKAISTNKSILNNYVKTGKYLVIKTSESEYYAIGLSKGNRELKIFIDGVLLKLKKTKQYNRLYNKWFE